MSAEASRLEGKYRSQALRNLDEGSAIHAWASRRMEDWSYPELAAVVEMTREDWIHYRSIIDEFKCLWPVFGDDGVTAQAVVQRHLRQQPKERRSGVVYDAPYSLKQHLEALRVHTGYEHPSSQKSYID